MATLTIGLLIDWLDNDYASSLTFAFNDEVCSRKMRFLCFVGHGIMPGQAKDGSNIAYELASRRCLDGVVIASLGPAASREDYLACIERLRPLPMCTLVAPIQSVPQIAVDDAAGMRDAVQHLIDVHGKRRIAFIRGPEGIPDADERYRGYLAALASRQLVFDPSLVATGGFTFESGRVAASELLERGESRFDALAAANDAMAAAAMTELSARGFSIPEDVAVCGFDDVEESRFANPPISSVRQPWRPRARLAIDSILAQRAGRSVQSQGVAAEFVPRGSCGCGVRFDAAGPADAPSLALRVANWDWRNSAASSLSRELALRGIALADEPARALVECYWQEVQGQRDGGFLLLLEQELSERLVERASLSAWLYTLARLRSDALDRLPGRPDARAKAETLIHAALERVSYAMERQQALRRLDFERQGRLLALAGQAMRTAFDTHGISLSLGQQLPELGIPRFYISQYGAAPENDPLPARSRLVITHAGPDQPRRESIEFDTGLLVPEGCWPDEPVGFVLEALHFQEERLGFAIFQIGPRQGSIYMALREQLSAALKGAALVGQVAQRALQREQAERARMEEELRIARRIQVSILPTRWLIEGLDVAAALLPGQLPGADYFDVRPDDRGAWLAVGSARGGGLRAGLITPMLQSIVASLCQSRTLLSPLELLRLALHVLRENLEVRMQERKYVNLLVARYSTGGLLRFAADFEGVTLCPWHGSPFRPELLVLGESPGGEPLLGGEFQLSPHDLLMLYTQGLTRSSDFEDAPIGDERIARELEHNRASPVEKIRDDMLSTVQRWSGKRADLSVIVGRRLGAS